LAFDPFLYVALAAGIVAGRLSRVRSPWTGRATRATVVGLVGLLGTLLDTVPPASLALIVPIALGFAGLLLAVTAGMYLVLAHRDSRPPGGVGIPRPAEPLPFSVVLIAALLAGFALGRVVSLPTDLAITWALYVLLALVGFELPLQRIGARELAIPLSAAAAGSLACALVLIVVGVAGPVAFSTTFAFGWYTLAGPLVAARAGALLGLFAFLSNFFRENLTMVLSPYLGRRLRGPGLTALGGATSMDTTLYFVTRYGDETAGSLALASGLVLTLTAGVLLPLFLALPF
jgi:uncharacterized membrane protein YbjE (DUF340 family)